MSSLPTFANNIKDPKMGIENEEEEEAMLIRSRPRGIARGVAVSVLVAFIYFFILAPAAPQFGCTVLKYIGIPKSTEQPLVPLEAHVMSKCPDARDCLKMMVLPTMQRVMDKVNFTLSFIGTPTDNDGVDCMHGPEECMGNIIELCAAKLYPNPKTYLGFTMCLSRDYHSIPQKSLVEDCALEHGIDFGKLNDCTLEDNGGTAMALLRDSVRRSTQAGVTKSCTVRLDEKIYCIRDGGKWSDCPNGPGVNDLVIAIEKLYNSGSAPSEERISPSRAH